MDCEMDATLGEMVERRNHHLPGMISLLVWLVVGGFHCHAAAAGTILVCLCCMTLVGGEYVGGES